MGVPSEFSAYIASAQFLRGIGPIVNLASGLAARSTFHQACLREKGRAGIEGECHRKKVSQRDCVHGHNPVAERNQDMGAAARVDP
jgi:hypothetical protein